MHSDRFAMGRSHVYHGESRAYCTLGRWFVESNQRNGKEHQSHTHDILHMTCYCFSEHCPGCSILNTVQWQTMTYCTDSPIYPWQPHEAAYLFIQCTKNKRITGYSRLSDFQQRNHIVPREAQQSIYPQLREHITWASFHLHSTQYSISGGLNRSPDFSEPFSRFLLQMISLQYLTVKHPIANASHWISSLNNPCPVMGRGKKNTFPYTWYILPLLINQRNGPLK